jgi:hypothetical protein
VQEVDAVRTYVVKQSEYLGKIAAQYGLDADTVWNDPANRDLVARRKDPNVLASGDVLHLPDPAPAKLTFKPGQTNAFTATLTRVDVATVFSNLGKPLANEDYEVDGLGAVVKGTTDGDGAATVTATTLVDRVTVRFPAKGLAFQLSLGHLDPPDEVSGATQRLANLGYLVAAPTGALKERVRSRGKTDDGTAQFDAALRAFQRDEGLEENGQLDESTCDALVSRNGA